MEDQTNRIINDRTKRIAKRNEERIAKRNEDRAERMRGGGQSIDIAIQQLNALGSQRLCLGFIGRKLALPPYI